MESLLPYFFYAVIGVGAGFLAGLLGIGGGLIVVPALAYALNLLNFPAEYAMQTAVGTSLAAMIFTSASSAFAHFRQKGIVWDLFKALTPGIAIGAFVGSCFADSLSSNQLRLFFGYSVCLIGIYFLFPLRKHEEQEKKKEINPITLGFQGALIGAVSSVLGIGGGILTVPLLTSYHFSLRQAISTSAITGFVIAIVGALTFMALGLKHESSGNTFGYIYLPAFITISITSMIAAPFGAKLAYTLPIPLLRRVFGILLLGVGIAMVLYT